MVAAVLAALGAGLAVARSSALVLLAKLARLDVALRRLVLAGQGGVVRVRLSGVAVLALVLRRRRLAVPGRVVPAVPVVPVVPGRPRGVLLALARQARARPLALLGLGVVRWPRLLLVLLLGGGGLVVAAPREEKENLRHLVLLVRGLRLERVGARLLRIAPRPSR
eukprot:5402612-Pyramimonas_sp.AAC.1